MKKVAFFVGELAAEYQREVCMFIEEECRQNQIQLTIFQNFPVFGTNVFHALGEQSIVHLADLSKFDGFIIAPDTFSVEGLQDELVNNLQTLPEMPVISLRQEVDCFYNVLVDDYSALFQVVEHLITHHGMTRICFMKGLNYLKDAQIRFQAYLDAMEKYHLPVTDKMTFDGDYWRGKGDEAVAWFLDDVPMPPQAIVCANDYMGISVINSLNKRGLRVPEDIAVTGFDDREEAKFAIPSMTSVHVESELFAQKAVSMLLNIWEGKTQIKNEMIPATALIRESCGCKMENAVEEHVLLFRAKEHLNNAIGQVNFMNVDCENVNTLDELCQVASNYIMEDEKIYLCLCDESEKEAEKMEMSGKFTKNMELKAIMSRKATQIVNQTFLREELLPAEYIAENQTLLVNTIHDKNEILGYLVVSGMLSDRMRAFYQMWVQCVVTTIGRLRMTSRNEQMSSLVDLLNRDELTGMYNRRELDRALKRAHDKLAIEGKSYYVISIDMDGLKYINDTYGHVVGDEAIKEIATIIESSVNEQGIAARTGGDEFVICYGDDDEASVKRMIYNIKEKISNVNIYGGRPYELSASIGYSRCNRGSTPLACIQAADIDMYLEKRQKKNARVD